MNETNNLMLPCRGGMCDFALELATGNNFCVSGDGSCMLADLLEAEPSNFHDRTLVEATAAIKQILAGVPEDADGRKLSFLITDLGILLAWTDHNSEAPAKVVTARDSKEVVTQALKLKLV